MGNYIVYMATNTINGKRYIGASIRGLEERKKSHKYDSRNCRPGCKRLYRAFRKYGFDCFKWTVLERLSSKDDMFKAEVRLIKELKPEYNLTKGGEGLVDIVNNHKNKNVKPVICLNDGKVFNSGVDAYMYYGIQRSNFYAMIHKGYGTCDGKSFMYSNTEMDESERSHHLRVIQNRNKLRDSLIGKRKSKKILCLNDNKIYNSLVEASRHYGINKVTIANIAKKQFKSSRSGLGFIYI